MSEFLDVYNKYGKKKNKVIRRGDAISKGEYHLVSEGWIRTDKEHYLIQKRSRRKRLFGGKWYCSVGGSVLAGEDPKDGLIRETREELGLDISNSKIRLKRIIVEGYRIFYIYLIDKKVDINNLKLQKEEVEDARIVTEAEMEQLIEEGKMIKLNYYESFFESARKIPIDYMEE